LKGAQETAERLAARKDLLTARQSAELEARVAWLKGDAEARFNLFNARPDDADLGLQVALSRAPPKKRLALVKRIRQLPPPVSEDLLLDAAEAGPISADDRKRADELLDRLQERARKLGARSEEALAYRIRARLLPGLSGRLAALREEIRLHSEVGDLDALAQATSTRAYALYEGGGTPSEVLNAFDEAAGASRRIGNRLGLYAVLTLSADALWAAGEAELARKRLEEARLEAETLGEPPSGAYLVAKSKLQCFDADLAECRAGVKALAAIMGEDNPNIVLFEAQLLLEQDQLEEARASWRRAAEAMKRAGNIYWVLPAAQACKARCEQGYPAEGLACLAEIPETNYEMGQTERHRSEARCRFLSKDALGAESAARRVISGAPDWFLDRARGEIALGSALAARGQTAKAIPELRRLLADIEARRLYRLFALEAALALGEAEVAAGVPAGRVRLVRLEREAKEREHFRIARLAREALDRRPP
jgi:hypothetical protein